MERLIQSAKQLNGKNWRFIDGDMVRNLVFIDRNGVKKPEIQHILCKNKYHVQLLPFLVSKRAQDIDEVDEVHWFIKHKDGPPITMTVSVNESQRVFDIVNSCKASIVAVMPM